MQIVRQMTMAIFFNYFHLSIEYFRGPMPLKVPTPCFPTTHQ